MSKDSKDAADLFAAEGEEARKILEGLKEQAQDALDVAVSKTPPKSDTLSQYRYVKEKELPLIMRLEDPGVEGAQPRTVQEVLASLASTGYLDCDRRGGSQGFTYTLTRDPEGMTLGIYLDPLPGEAIDAKQTRGSRGTATAH